VARGVVPRLLHLRAVVGCDARVLGVVERRPYRQHAVLPARVVRVVHPHRHVLHPRQGGHPLLKVLLEPEAEHQAGVPVAFPLVGDEVAEGVDDEPGALRAVLPRDLQRLHRLDHVRMTPEHDIGSRLDHRLLERPLTL